MTSCKLFQTRISKRRQGLLLRYQCHCATTGPANIVSKAMQSSQGRFLTYQCCNIRVDGCHAQVLASNPHTSAFFTPAMADCIVKDAAGQMRAQIVRHVMDAAGARHQVRCPCHPTYVAHLLPLAARADTMKMHKLRNDLILPCFCSSTAALAGPYWGE